ncbi:MAG: glycosyltransferase family 2 protein [Lachnospiraceae bacterium]|nr:glycosyltransferase family 2 protein [Lachnospiraceae bacterium]
MSELLSVIVPVYNTKAYLGKCVQSICNQTYENLEIILVDDGSTDGSGIACDTLAATDKRIKVIHKENGGSSSARNVGIRAARGKYIGFVDSDDYIEPMMYERLYEVIHTYGVQMAQAGRDEINEQGEKLPDICACVQANSAVSSKDFVKELLMHRGDCSFCTKLLDASLLAGEEFPEGILNEDFYLLLKLLTKTEGIVLIPYVGYHVFYRIGSNTRTQDKNTFSRVFSDNVDNADYAAKVVEQYFPELKEEVIRFGFVQRIDYLLHVPIGKMNRENMQYRAIIRYLRKNKSKMLGNKLLSIKNKCYLLLFTLMPVWTRKIHATKMRISGNK